MKETITKLFDSRNAVTGLFVVIAISLMFNTLKVIQRNYELQQQVDQLTDEVALIEVQNQNLAYNIEYYKTDAYLEIEAKRRLNLAEKGEQVIFLPKDGDVVPEDVELQAPDASDLENAPKSQQRENFENWMTFLFGSTGGGR